MKYGVRKPNIKKSVKAKTTGKVKRQVKKSVNPLYGQKGMGVVNDPKKAAYNAVYNKTTVSAKDAISFATGEPETTSDDNVSVFSLIVTFFQLLFSIVQLVFWLAIVVGIIAFLIWIF